MNLTKSQLDALVEEVEDRLQGPSQVVFPRGSEKTWEGIRDKLDKQHDYEVRIQKLNEELEDLEEEQKDFERGLRTEITNFEKKTGLEVNWKYIDRDIGEKPTVTYPSKEMADKIRRQIHILSIDKKGPKTADELIAAVISKFETI